MPDKATTTTPDPELSSKLGNTPTDVLGGDNPRGEVAGCPTGLPLATDPQAQQPQQPSGGGAPETGCLFSPAEAVNEQQ